MAKVKHKEVLLTDVLYVPDLRGNLLSLKKLTLKGYEVNFKDGMCTIVKANITVALAAEQKPNGLFVLKAFEDCALVTQKNQCNAEFIHAWHNRLGHRDPKAIKQIESQSLALNFSIKSCNKKEFCESCI